MLELDKMLEQNRLKAWNDFLHFVKIALENNELDSFLALYLTDDEKNMLAVRHEILARLLKKEDTQRQIAKELQISISKVTRGSNALKKVSKQLQEFMLLNIKGKNNENI